MPTAHRLPSGSWRVRVSVKEDGRYTTKSFTAATKPEAERLAARLIAGVDKKTAAPVTFSAAAEEYLRDREAVLSPATLRAYKTILRNSCASIAALRLDRLAQTDVQRQINRVAAAHSPKTTRNVAAFIGAVLSVYAPDLRLSLDLPQRKKADISVPDDADVRRLLDASSGDLKTAIVLAASLGLRRGEICALTWSDVDLDAGAVWISKDMVRTAQNTWVIKPPKTYTSHRTLDLPAGCAAYLRGLYFDLSGRSKSLTAPDARIVSKNPGAITDSFIRARRRAGVSCRFHDLRHYYASLMLALGVPDKYAMERMGHATPGMLKTVYQHTREQKQAEISRQISAALDAALPLPEK